MTALGWDEWARHDAVAPAAQAERAGPDWLGAVLRGRVARVDGDALAASFAASAD